MDTHSELPVGDPTSDAGLLIHKLGLAINHNPQLAASVLAQNAELRETLEWFLGLVLDTDKQPPRDQIYAAVDNSASDSMEIDPIIHNDVVDLNIDETDCSPGTVVSPPLQAALPRWPVSSLMVSPTAINSSNRSALVIEHDRSLSRMYATYFKYEGYVVRTAYESEDALRLYRDCAPFDVVLIDYGMPRKNGVNIATSILKQDPTQPMIMAALDYSTEDEVLRPNELRHVPLLLEMSNGRLRKLLQKYQRWATREEVDRASNALAAAELLKLQKFGDSRVYFSRGTDYRTGKDLLQEALRLTFEGAEDRESGRHWNKRVTFVTHLIGVIKSISGRRKDDGPLLECDTVECDANGHEFSLLGNVAARGMAADHNLIARERVAGIFRTFKDDPEAVLVLQGWSEGMKRNEIIEEGLSENQYRAAVKRIRMKLLSPKNGGGEKHDGQH